MKLKYTISLLGILTVGGATVCLSLPSCNSQTYTTKWIAHRGAPGGDGTEENTHFENIVESYEKAGLHNFWGMETDVYRTDDGGWVVVHDDNPFYQTTAGEDGIYQRDTGTYVNEIDYETAMSKNIIPSKNYPAFVNDNKAPHHHLNSFSDYLNVCKMYDKEAIIEIKEPSHLANTYPKTEEEGYLLYTDDSGDEHNYLSDLWDQIEDAGMQEQCVIISFQQCYIQWFAHEHTDLNDEHRLQMLVDNYVDDTDSDSNTPYKDLVDGTWDDGTKYDVSMAGEETAYLGKENPHIVPTQDMVDYAHANGRQFALWTVDIQKYADKYLKMGVDYLTTDYWKLVDSINDVPKAINQS